MSPEAGAQVMHTLAELLHRVRQQEEWQHGVNRTLADHERRPDALEARARGAEDRLAALAQRVGRRGGVR
jgi:hypothetical protein